MAANTARPDGRERGDGNSKENKNKQTENNNKNNKNNQKQQSPCSAASAAAVLAAEGRAVSAPARSAVPPWPTPSHSGPRAPRRAAARTSNA